MFENTPRACLEKHPHTASLLKRLAPRMKEDECYPKGVKKQQQKKKKKLLKALNPSKASIRDELTQRFLK